MTPAPELRPRVIGRWAAAELGLPPHATFRCLLPLPGGGMALGSDYGLVLWDPAGGFSPFPFPAGARREGRRVEAMAAHGGALHVATAKSYYRWPFAGEAAGRGLPRDGLGVVDELRALHAAGDDLIRAWRTRLEAPPELAGPPECCCFAAGGGAIWAGTLDGQLWRLGAGPQRRFADAAGRPWPVRHLAWYRGLWVAAGRALHHLSGGRWRAREGEPYALHVAGGALWTLRAGGLWCGRGGRWPERVPVALSRPWSLGSDAEGALWVGELGRVSRLAIRGRSGSPPRGP